jgi:hypothetical protein
MTNENNNIIQYVFVDISRSQGCKNATCQNRGRKRREMTLSDEPRVPWKTVSVQRPDHLVHFKEV